MENPRDVRRSLYLNETPFLFFCAFQAKFGGVRKKDVFLTFGLRQNGLGSLRFSSVGNGGDFQTVTVSVARSSFDGLADE